MSNAFLGQSEMLHGRLFVCEFVCMSGFNSWFGHVYIYIFLYLYIYTRGPKVRMPRLETVHGNLENFADGGGILTFDGQLFFFHRKLECRQHLPMCPKCCKYQSFWPFLWLECRAGTR